jgi:hypothetical protein
VLAPGESTVVELVFNTKTSRGPINKSARVTSNDSLKATVNIDFRGQIVPDTGMNVVLRPVPSKVEFIKGKETEIVTLVNNSKSEIVPALISEPWDDVELKIKDRHIRSGKKGEVEISWKGSVPEYDITRSLTFETGNTDLPRFTIPYTIKGTRGPRPAPAHTPPKQTAKSQPNIQRPPSTAMPAGSAVKAQQKGEKGAADVKKKEDEKPVTGAQWPPK